LTFDLWPFDLKINACRATDMYCMSTKFGVDSSSRLPFTAWTHRHTQSQTSLITLPTSRLLPAWVIIS